jgi:hypothetical protein
MGKVGKNRKGKILIKSYHEKDANYYYIPMYLVNRSSPSFWNLQLFPNIVIFIFFANYFQNVCKTKEKYFSKSSLCTKLVFLPSYYYKAPAT